MFIASFGKVDLKNKNDKARQGGLEQVLQSIAMNFDFQVTVGKTSEIQAMRALSSNHMLSCFSSPNSGKVVRKEDDKA